MSQLLGGSGAGLKSVQQRTITLGAATTATDTITAVDPANTELVLLGVSSPSSATDLSQSSVSIDLTNATTVTAFHFSTSGFNFTVSYEVREYYPGFLRSVQRGTLTMTATPKTAALATTLTDITRCRTANLGFTTSTTTYDGQIIPRLALTNATTLTATSGLANAAMVQRYQIVEEY